jgi:hypothetical protein
VEEKQKKRHRRRKELYPETTKPDAQQGRCTNSIRVSDVYWGEDKRKRVMCYKVSIDFFHWIPVPRVFAHEEAPPTTYQKRRVFVCELLFLYFLIGLLPSDSPLRVAVGRQCVIPKLHRRTSRCPRAIACLVRRMLWWRLLSRFRG